MNDNITKNMDYDINDDSCYLAKEIHIKSCNKCYGNILCPRVSKK